MAATAMPAAKRDLRTSKLSFAEWELLAFSEQSRAWRRLRPHFRTSNR
jgi:hypothetical protein